MAGIVTAAAVEAVRIRAGFAGESEERQKPGRSAIPRHILGKTGVQVSALVLGGFVAMKDPPTAKFDPAELANAALDAGINYFDTAPAYGNGRSEHNRGEYGSWRTFCRRMNKTCDSSLVTRVTSHGTQTHIRLYRGPPVPSGQVQRILSKGHFRWQVLQCRQFEGLAGFTTS